MRIIEQSEARLVVQNKPILIMSGVIFMGAAALFASMLDIVLHRGGDFDDNIFGAVLGGIFVVGGFLFYRSTTLTLDKSDGSAEWRQDGVWFHKRRSARLCDIEGIVVGRPISDESGGATRVLVRVSGETWPLAFGFTGLNADKQIVAALEDFLK